MPNTLKESLITMNSPQINSVKVTIDMRPYIVAYQEYKLKQYLGNSKRNEKEVYFNLKDKLRNRLTGLSGDLLWEQVLELATDGLSSTEIEIIRSSPASSFMDNSFVEIIKNAMDEAILGYYQSLHNPRIELHINLDVQTDPHNISITIDDTGRGFSRKFLGNVATPDKRHHYVEQTNRTSRDAHPTDIPELFGGANRGLRILMAACEGDELEKAGVRNSKYVKPEISDIVFRNKTDGSGAIIKITTSKKPLEDIHVETPAPQNYLKANFQSLREKDCQLTLTDTESIESDFSEQEASPNYRGGNFSPRH